MKNPSIGSLAFSVAMLAVSGHAGTVDSSAFNSATVTAVSTSGVLDWGYVDKTSSRYTNGAPGNPNGEIDSIFLKNLSNVLYNDINTGLYTGGGTATVADLTTVGGTAPIGSVTLTENGDVGSGFGEPAIFTFDGNGAFGAYRNLGADNEWTINFNDLGIGTFNITLYLGINNNANANKVVQVDYSLLDGGPAITGSTDSAALNTYNLAASGRYTYTYDISVTTTTATADLALTFGRIGGGTAGEDHFAGYTIASATSVVADPAITSFSVSGDTATITMTGDDTVGYWCASSTDLTGWSTEETALQTGTANPVPTNPDGSFNTSGGTLTFDVDVTGDSKLFLRIQDTDPNP